MKNKTLLDELKKIVNILDIKKCYFKDLQETYSINLELEATFKLLDNIVPNEDTRIINIVFETEEYRITYNDWWLFSESEAFFKKEKLSQPPVITTIEPDSLLYTFEYILGDGKKYQIPIETDEEKFLDVFLTTDEKCVFEKNKYKINVMKSIEWLQKVAIKILNSRNIYKFSSVLPEDDFLWVYGNFDVNKFVYIILPKDFKVTELKQKYIVPTISLDEHIQNFKWYDLFLNKEFIEKENIYDKLPRMGITCDCNIDMIDENNNMFTFYPNDEHIKETQEIIFKNLIEKDKMRRAIFINEEFFVENRTKKVAFKEYIDEVAEEITNLYKKQKLGDK